MSEQALRQIEIESHAAYLLASLSFINRTQKGGLAA